MYLEILLERGLWPPGFYNDGKAHLHLGLPPLPPRGPLFPWGPLFR